MLHLDADTAFTAMAINVDIITIKNLSRAYVLIESLLYNGTEFRVEVMYHRGTE